MWWWWWWLLTARVGIHGDLAAIVPIKAGAQTNDAIQCKGGTRLGTNGGRHGTRFGIAPLQFLLPLTALFGVQPALRFHAGCTEQRQTRLALVVEIIVIIVVVVTVQSVQALEIKVPRCGVFEVKRAGAPQGFGFVVGCSPDRFLNVFVLVP